MRYLSTNSAFFPFWIIRTHLVATLLNMYSSPKIATYHKHLDSRGGQECLPCSSCFPAWQFRVCSVQECSWDLAWVVLCPPCTLLSLRALSRPPQWARWAGSSSWLWCTSPELAFMLLGFLSASFRESLTYGSSPIRFSTSWWWPQPLSTSMGSPTFRNSVMAWKVAVLMTPFSEPSHLEVEEELPKCF